MSRRRTTTLLAALMLMAGCAESPTSPMPGELDASLNGTGGAFLPGEQQPLANLLVGGLAIYPEMAGQNLTQTFTPAQDQWLGYLQLPVGCAAGVLLNVKIRDGLAGPILYEANHAGLAGIAFGTFQLLQVFNPAVTPQGIGLLAGHTYAFELAAFPGPGAAGNSCGIARGPSGNLYAGGRGYYRDPINGTPWFPIPNGASTDDEDLPFITLVQPRSVSSPLEAVLAGTMWFRSGLKDWRIGADTHFEGTLPVGRITFRDDGRKTMAFAAERISSIVVSETKAVIQASGVIAGRSGTFAILAVLRDDGSGLVNGARVRITDAAGSVVFDNQPGEPIDSDVVTPGFSSVLTIRRSGPAAMPVATVQVTLAAGSLAVGQTTQATAVLRDATGVVLIGRPVTWASSNAGVAAVSAAGLVTALAPGIAEIRAMSEAKSAGAVAIVVPLTPATPVASWTNPAGGNWSDASNWSLGRVPRTTDSVVIALPGTYTVMLDTTFSASSLDIGGATGTQTLILKSRTLSVGAILTITGHGVLAADSSTIAGPGMIFNSGMLTLRQSTFGASSRLFNQGTVVLRGTVTVNGSLTTSAASVLRLLPDMSTALANLTVTNGFTNNGVIELASTDHARPAQLSVPGSAMLTNAAGGTITSLVGTGGARSIDARLDNQGRVTVLQPLTLSHASAAHSNSGLIDATAADFTITQSGSAPSVTNTGSIVIGAARTWTVTNGTLNLSAGSIGGPGTLNLQSVTANFTTNFSNATTGLTAINSTLNGPGTMTNAFGQLLSVRNTTFNMDLINQGTLITDGTTRVNTFTTVPGSLLQLQPTGFTGQSTFTAAPFTNYGVIVMTSSMGAYGATLNVTGGTGILTNSPIAVIYTLVGTGGPRSIGAQLDNQGWIMVQPGPNGTGLRINGSLTTSGTLSMEIGGLAPGTGYSQISVSGPATLGGTLNVSLLGLTPVTGSTFDILTSAALSGTLTLGTQPGGWAPPTYPANGVRLTAP